MIELENTHGDITVTHFYANSIQAASDSDRNLETTSSNAPQPVSESPEAKSTVNSSLQAVPSITNSPGCAPGNGTGLGESAATSSVHAGHRAPRLVRTVRVDAWAVPASTNWTRTRTTARKVTRGPRPAAWALPF